MGTHREIGYTDGCPFVEPKLIDIPDIIKRLTTQNTKTKEDELITFNKDSQTDRK